MKKLFIVAIPLLTLFACNKVNDVNFEDQNNVVSFTAEVDGDETKTAITESESNFPLSWTGGETVHVYPFPAEFPNPGSGSDVVYISTKYNFTNKLSAGNSAIFESTDFTPGAFETGKRYLVIYPQSLRNVAAYRGTTDPSDVVISTGRVVVPIPDEQTYNPSNNMGIQNNIIPMIGMVQKDGGEGREPEAVKMYGIASIVKLVVSNNSASAKTISKITMESSVVSTPTYGIAGNLAFKFSPGKLSLERTSTYWSNTAKQLITLTCTSPVSIPAGGSKVFSFVTGGNSEREIHGDFTWKVYDNSEQVIATATNLASTEIKLPAGKVYTKAIALY